MKFSHYNKSDILINPTNNLHFRRYLKDQNKRLIDYLEGRLTEITSEDFDNITYLNSYSLYMNEATYAVSGVLDGYYNKDKPLSINKIELGDKITTLKGDSNSSNITLLSPLHEGTLEIIFPPNLTDIYGVIGGGNNVIWNFSKVKQIPKYYYPSNSGPLQPQAIKVPASLYNRWKTAADWSWYKSVIVSV